MGYALRSSFIDPAYSTAVKIAYQEINRQRRILSNSLEIAQQHNLRFNFDRTLKQAQIEELMDHIHKLEDTVREKNSAKIEKSSSRVKERAGRTKRVIVKISLSRAACETPLSPNSSLSLDEETAPAIPKRKRSSSERRTSVTSGAGVEQSRLARPASSLAKDIVHSKPAPSPDSDDHLPIKKLKALHPQGSSSHIQAPV